MAVFIVQMYVDFFHFSFKRTYLPIKVLFRSYLDWSVRVCRLQRDPKISCIILSSQQECLLIMWFGEAHRPRPSYHLSPFMTYIGIHFDSRIWWDPFPLLFYYYYWQVYIQHWDLVGFFVPKLLTDSLKGKNSIYGKNVNPTLLSFATSFNYPHF